MTTNTPTIYAHKGWHEPPQSPIQKIADRTVSLFTDAQRLKRYDRIARVCILAPLALNGLFGRLFLGQGLPPRLVAVAQSVWIVRRCTSSAPIISKWIATKKGETINRDLGPIRFIENSAHLGAGTLGLVMLMETVTPLHLGALKPAILGSFHIYRVVGSSLTLGRNLHEKPKSTQSLQATLDWGYMAGTLLECKLPFIQLWFVPHVPAALLDNGFGILRSGFGAASAILGLSLAPVKR